MSTGQLRKRIDFKTVTLVSDGGGGGTETWATVFTVWGKYTPQRGRETLMSGQEFGSNKGVVRVRSTTQTKAITEDYICAFDNELFAIISPPINIDQRSKFIEFIVEKGASVS